MVEKKLSKITISCNSLITTTEQFVCSYVVPLVIVGSECKRIEHNFDKMEDITTTVPRQPPSHPALPTDETNCEDEEQPYKEKDEYRDGDYGNSDDHIDEETKIHQEEGKRKQKNIEIEYQNELSYLQKISPTHYRINFGFVPNMNVPADIIVNSELEELLLMELKEAITARFDSFTSKKVKQHFPQKEKDDDGQLEITGGNKKKKIDVKREQDISTDSNSFAEENTETEATASAIEYNIEESQTQNDVAKDESNDKDNTDIDNKLQSKSLTNRDGVILCMETMTLESKPPKESKEIFKVMQDQKKSDGKTTASKPGSNRKNKAKGGGRGRTNNPSFIPALKQMANVAALPGIVRCLAMPDVHSGYGFCIGNVAAFDMDDEDAVISPGGVGFDINCGVRLIRTNLTESDVQVGERREELAQTMYDHLPAGVGTDGVIPVSEEDIDEILETGIDWAIKQGYAWPQDKDHCEENGRMETAIPKKVSGRAKKRGLNQLGTLGGGNHYAEVQVVEEVYDEHAAKIMGIQKIGQVCIMIHTGSRGLGHQVATDAIKNMEKTINKAKIPLNDRQLCCAKINSKQGQDYLAAMSAAANYAWVNRSCMTYLTRKVFEKVFEKTAEEMEMHLVYDVCHNVAKIEKHVVSDDSATGGEGNESKDGKNKQTKTLLVHRKGSTRAFPPHHPSIPNDYKSIGQPALIGGTMGTCSYVLLGTNVGMEHTFGSTCHGAGRALSRNASRKRLDHKEVLQRLKDKNISIRVSNPKLVTEEAPESYKDVSNVVDTCHDAGISRKVVKLRPIAVVKG